MFSWSMLISGNKLAEQIRRFVTGSFLRQTITETELNENSKNFELMAKPEYRKFTAARHLNMPWRSGRTKRLLWRPISPRSDKSFLNSL